MDDTGFPKFGNAWVGLPANTILGHLGKVANCQVGVSIHAATDQASCPIDWRLFLPQRWDAEQRGAAVRTCRRRWGIDQVAAGAGHGGRAWRLGLARRWWWPMPAMGSRASCAWAGDARAGLRGPVKATTSAYPEAVAQQVAPYPGGASSWPGLPH